MVTVSDQFFYPYGNRFIYYFFSLLFFINYYTFNNRKFSKFLWNIIKLELFFVAGVCRHSGGCCQNIKLYHHGKFIHSVRLFNLLKRKFNLFGSFNPQISNDSNDGIIFNCSNLSSNNLCLNHSKRPSFCRNYPSSSLVMEYPLKDGCGFRIQATDFAPFWIPRCLNKKT